LGRGHKQPIDRAILYVISGCRSNDRRNSAMPCELLKGFDDDVSIRFSDVGRYREL